MAIAKEAAFFVGFRGPIAYVWDLVGEYGTTYFMYIDPEIYNPFVRLFLFPSPDLFWNMSNIRYVMNDPIYPDPSRFYWGTIDFNCWTAFIKTGLFSEVGLGATQQTFGDYRGKFKEEVMHIAPYFTDPRTLDFDGTIVVETLSGNFYVMINPTRQTFENKKIDAFAHSLYEKQKPYKNLVIISRGMFAANVNRVKYMTYRMASLYSKI